MQVLLPRLKDTTKKWQEKSPKKFYDFHLVTLCSWSQKTRQQDFCLIQIADHDYHVKKELWGICTTFFGTIELSLGTFEGCQLYTGKYDWRCLLETRNKDLVLSEMKPIVGSVTTLCKFLQKFQPTRVMGKRWRNGKCQSELNGLKGRSPFKLPLLSQLSTHVDALITTIISLLGFAFDWWELLYLRSLLGDFSINFLLRICGHDCLM